MKKRSPLLQHNHKKQAGRVALPPKSPEEPAEVSFWLAKISPKIMAQIDERRKKLGHNKKVTVTCMALAYLQATDSDYPPILQALQDRAEAVSHSVTAKD